MSHQRKIAILGPGHAGLPAATAFARGAVPVRACDTDEGRVSDIKTKRDRAAALVGAADGHG